MWHVRVHVRVRVLVRVRVHVQHLELCQPLVAVPMQLVRVVRGVQSLQPIRCCSARRALLRLALLRLARSAADSSGGVVATRRTRPPGLAASSASCTLLISAQSVLRGARKQCESF